MSKVLVFGKHKSTSLTVSTIQGKICCSSYLTDQKKKNHLPNLGFIQPKIQNKLEENSGEVTKNEDSEAPVAPQKKKGITSCASSDQNTEFRKNEFNIQMLSKSLHRQIFGDTQNSKQINPDLIHRAREKLNEYGLLKNEINLLDDISINLPPFKGKNIAQHFQAIGEEQCKPYRELVNSFIRNGLPNSPKEWLCQKGWTKYVEGEEPVSVPFPDEDIFVFDVEVCVNLGELPTLATAVSPNAWYGWICSDLAEGIASIPKNRYNTSMLIPFEGKTVSKEKPRIIVGHSVSYDRARIKEQYYLKSSALRFVDTMSMHICIGGLNRVQKNLINKTPSNEDLMSDFGKDMCLCSLKELYALYCDKDLPKEERNTFLNGSMADVKENFQNLMSYCANDVKATFEVLQAIFPVFLKRFPHPVTLAGMLEMGSAFLPVNKNWNKFLNEADQTYEDSKNEISSVISKKCDNACSLLHNEMYKEDMWMWDEDWKTQQLKLTQRIKKKKPREDQEEPEKFQQKQTEVEEDEEEKILQAKYQYLFDLKRALPKKLPFLPGYPQWYRNLCEKPDSSHWTLSPQVTTSMKITPKLLKLKWENFPLHHTQKYGWGILIPDLLAENVETSVPFEKLKELTIKNCNVDLKKLHKMLRKKSKEIKFFPKLYYKGSAEACDYVVDNCCYFFKMPNVNGSRRNVGNPLSKEISQAFVNGVLSSSDPIAEKVLDLGSKITYWRNNRQRITSQMIVWLNKKEAGIPSESDEDSLTGIIIPQVVVCGTLTRRAMESTWLTASRVTENRIGSELRAMIQTPPGYHFVGADVDSQELWIASLLGDSCSKIHGSTPLGWMTLSGTKSTGTDLHSVTAKAVGISRAHAKIINYSRIYGASTKFALKLLKQFNPSMSENEAWSKVEKMYKLTKGTKEFLLKNSFQEKYPSLLDFQMCDMSTAVRISKRLKKKIEDIFEKSKWINGSESAMFNRLEEIATSERPTTPFLKCRLSRALEPRFEGDDLHLRTKINWVVQSGAVDFLHLMLVCMKWLTNGKARYCFSFHDEVRFMVPSDERYNAALALHITNLLVRSFCAHSLDMHDLPQSVAFFSAVEIDKALRKEANDDCVTASNPHGLKKEYGVGPGETLNIYEAIEKTGGKLASFETSKKIVSSISSTEILEKKTEMSQATKRKHVYREVLQGELEPPKENQQIVKVLGSKGSNLHQVETTDCTTFLVSMPNKFRNNVWIKRGDFVYIEPTEGSGKVKAEIVNILTSDHIKYLKKEGFWPSEFSKKTDEGETNDEKDSL